MRNALRLAMPAHGVHNNAPAPFSMNAGNWPGTLRVRRTATSPPANSGVFTFACWLRMQGGDGTAMDILKCQTAGGSIRFTTRRDSVNKILVMANSSAGTALLGGSTSSTNTVLATTGWKAVMISGDRAANSGAGRIQIYLNDTAERDTTWTDATEDIDFNGAPNWAIGGTHGSASNALIGDLGNVLLDTTTFVDFSVEANRRKVISALAKPVDLGANGSLLTGAQPLIYMGNPDDYADWDAGTVNRGTLDAAAVWNKQGTGNITFAAGP